MKKKIIEKEILIEDLVLEYPLSVDFLSENGIRCIRCGEAIWGTLEEAILDKGYLAKDVVKFLKDLNSLYGN